MQRTSTILAAMIGACLFWSAIFIGHQTLDDEPHPDLRDDALKEALRADWDHKAMSYRMARRLIFTEIDGDGTLVEGRYTGESRHYFGMPPGSVAQVEHTWPRSRLPKKASGDLHHLFPVIPQANRIRRDIRFGTVVQPRWKRGGSKMGKTKDGRWAFEVRQDHRGDVARAMFYVATMYELEIPDREEWTLRKWHADDPVSKAEKRRNWVVSRHQRSRNPYVDFPGLTERISDF